MAPFGPDNMRPIFVSRGVKDSGNSRVLKEEHLKLSLVQEEYPEIIVDAIAFNMGHLYEKIKDKKFDIVYTIEENSWNGYTNLQLMIRDLKVVD